MPSALAMPVALRKAAEAATGFLPADEGTELFGRACVALPHGPALEIGTYCGGSATYLGASDHGYAVLVRRSADDVAVRRGKPQ